MKLVIKYHAQSDTLWLGNSETASEGEDIAENVIVFFRDDRPVAVHIDHAAELLMPILSRRADYPAVESAGNPAVDAAPQPMVKSGYPVVETAPNPAVDTAPNPAVDTTPTVESDYPVVETTPNPAGDAAYVPAVDTAAAGPVGE